MISKKQNINIHVCTCYPIVPTQSLTHTPPLLLLPRPSLPSPHTHSLPYGHPFHLTPPPLPCPSLPLPLTHSPGSLQKTVSGLQKLSSGEQAQPQLKLEGRVATMVAGGIQKLDVVLKRKGGREGGRKMRKILQLVYQVPKNP